MKQSLELKVRKDRCLDCTVLDCHCHWIVSQGNEIYKRCDSLNNDSQLPGNKEIAESLIFIDGPKKKIGSCELYAS